MRVKELIELLKSQDQDAIVAISSDGEGNCIKPLMEPLEAGMAVKGDWNNEFDPIHPEDIDEYEQDEVFDVLTLYPE